MYIKLLGILFFLFSNQLMSQNTMKSEHILYNINIHGKDFPKNIQPLINKLSSFFKGNVNLDLSEESLNEIDNYMIENNIHFDEPMINEYMMCFIAYTGQVYIHTHGGEWEMCLHKDRETWAPFIRTTNGKLFDLFIWIYDSLTEDEFSTIGNGYFAVTQNPFTGFLQPKR